MGVFTIASKNYLAYVRVLLKSVAAAHPEYALFLCLVDDVEDAFDPGAEPFRVVQSDNIGIPHFDDMSVRYDIMELNTAVKPFMFQWMINNTNLDTIIYLDPDIQVYSRFDQLESILEADVSVVLTPHITQPAEDGRNPNDYHMLQTGIFNLGFAAINRCTESIQFIKWWGRRLETQGHADFSRNLFTDQRWCDLAPCFLRGLHILKDPSYNVAYWNLAERQIYCVRGTWRVNDRPLAFFHFSGVSASNEDVISKHQNRFSWKDIPNCKPLFDEYRRALIEEGWEETKTWRYVYATTKEGLPLPLIVRQLYRDNYPSPQCFSDASATEKVIDLCNGSPSSVPFSGGPITRLMELIYRQRPDLQATYDLRTHEGRGGFQRWYISAGAFEYNLPSQLLPRTQSMSAGPRLLRPQGDSGDSHRDLRSHCRQASRVVGVGIDATPENTGPDMIRIWNRIPLSVKHLIAPVLKGILGEYVLDETPEARSVKQDTVFNAPNTHRIDVLQSRAALNQFLADGRYISVLMHMIWASRDDLQKTFDLSTFNGQQAYFGWFEASAQREYGLDIRREGFNVRRIDDGSRPSRPGANLIGYANAELGMGEHVRMTAAALATTKLEFGITNFVVGVASRRSARVDFGAVLSNNPFAANVFHINADQMLLAYCQLGRHFFAGRFNIGYWAWELPKCPTQWMPVVKIMDEIWAPSRFVQRSFADHADVPVEHMPLCVTLPDFSRLGRVHFCLPNPAFIFLYVFDFFSFLERKNPFGAIRAFKLAFLERRMEVCLVLKIMNGNEESEIWQTMMRLIDNDPRIIVINRTMSREEILALFDVSDCFISLHRSEGFGRGPAEAMYLGKPVIVTNYSGNTDFTLTDNSCLVNFSLIDVKAGEYPFHEGQQWADPDIEHAAWYMKKLYSDPVYARDIGSRGKSYILKHFNRRTIGAKYVARLTKLGLV